MCLPFEFWCHAIGHEVVKSAKGLSDPAPEERSEPGLQPSGRGGGGQAKVAAAQDHDGRGRQGHRGSHRQAGVKKSLTDVIY